MDLFELTNTHGVIGFLIEITLKGTLILASAGLAASLLKSASAAVRHLVWSTALVLILALPAFVAVAPSYDVAVLPPEIESMTRPDLPAARHQDNRSRIEDRTVRAGMLDAQSSLEEGGPVSVAPIPALPAAKPNPLPAVRSSELRASSETFDWREALLALWIIGASLVALRYGLGWVALRRIKRRTVPVSDVRLRLLVKRIGAGIGLRRRIRLLWGPLGSMPLTFGCLHPTVLLPEGAKDWAPERLMVVLRHELAHVKRWDCLVQAVVYIACTLYWFNPFVWIAAAQSHREREMACDDYVLSGGSEGSEYAGHLLEIARSLQSPSFSGLTTIAMARRSELEGRLLAILSTNRRRGTATTQGVLTTFAILGCLVMTIAALRPVAMKAGDRPIQAETEPVAALPAQPAVWPQAAIPADASDASISVTAHIDEQYIAEASALVEKAAATLEASVNRLIPKTIRLNGSVAAMIDGSVSLAADARLEIVRPDTIPLEQIRRLRNAGVDVEYIEEMASVGFDRLTVDQLISLAHAGVDAEYVRRLRASGFSELSPDDLADLGFAGVDVEDIQVWADLGYDNLSSRELIKLAHAGLDAADVRALAEAGYAGLSPSELVQFGHAGVDPEFIRSMKELGFTDLSSRDLIRLSHADVDALYIRRLSEMGLSGLSADDLVNLGHADVDVEFIAEMRAAGYDNLSSNDLVALCHADVDARFVRELAEMGLKNLSVSDLIKLGHADVDGSFIRGMREIGYDSLSVDELIQAGHADVDPDYVAELSRAGIKSVSVMDLVQLSHAEIDADVVADLSQAGLQNLSTQELIQLGFAEVDGEYISEMASVGLTQLSASDLILLAHAGVDVDDVRQMRELGIDATDPEKIVQFKYMDIDPDYVSRVRRALDRDR